MPQCTIHNYTSDITHVRENIITRVRENIIIHVRENIIIHVRNDGGNCQYKVHVCSYAIFQFHHALVRQDTSTACERVS